MYIRRGDAIEAIRRTRDIHSLMDIPSADDENYLFAEDYNYCPNCGALMAEGVAENATTTDEDEILREQVRSFIDLVDATRADMGGNDK